MTLRPGVILAQLKKKPAVHIQRCRGHLLVVSWVSVLRYLLEEAEPVTHKTRQVASLLFQITKRTFPKLPKFSKTNIYSQLKVIKLPRRHRRTRPTQGLFIAAC